MDCNHDFSEGHYCPKCGAFDQDVAQEMAGSIAELETRLESEEAHYTRLVEQLAEERAKNERLSNITPLMVDKAYRHLTGVIDLDAAQTFVEIYKTMHQAALDEVEQ